MGLQHLNKFPAKGKCMFCKSSQVDPENLGQIYQFKDIAVHYYCMLMASRLRQNGRDKQGILGFFPKDIKEECQRAMSTICRYCKKPGATVSCARSSCRTHFHLPCGIEHGTLHEFFGEFKSFCSRHFTRQLLPSKVRNNVRGNCIICCSSIQIDRNSFWPPCCKPPSVMHRLCIQKLSLNSGYYLKCPLCNAVDEFVNGVQRFGVYVPQQEASWERESNAYRDLYECNLRCEAKICSCGKGRKHNLKHSKWQLVRCRNCEGTGIHLGCSSSWTPGNYNVDWFCFVCNDILNSHDEIADDSDQTDNGADTSEAVEDMTHEDIDNALATIQSESKTDGRDFLSYKETRDMYLLDGNGVEPVVREETVTSTELEETAEPIVETSQPRARRTKRKREELIRLLADLVSPEFSDFSLITHGYNGRRTRSSVRLQEVSQ